MPSFKSGNKKFSLEPLGGLSAAERHFKPGAPEPYFPLTRFQLNPELTRQMKETEDRLMQAVKMKAVRIEHEAYEKGFAQGEKDGLETGQKRLEVVIRQVGQLLQEMEHRKEELFRQSEGELIDFVFCLIRKILRRESQLSEGVIRDTLWEAFQLVEQNRRVVLHLNPVDFKFLLAHSDQLPFVLSDRERIKILENQAVSVGGCLLETDYGVIDATLEGQFDQIVERITGRIGTACPR